MPKVSKAHLEARRQQILDAAIDQFVRHGFDGTTMVDIVSAAGISAGNVYRYFRTKEDLIHAIIDLAVEQNVTAMVRQIRINPAPDPVEALVDQLRVLERVLLSENANIAKILPEVWAVVIRTPTLQARMQRLFRDLYRTFTELSKAYLADHPEIREVSPETIAHLLVSLLQGYFVQRVVAGTPLDVDTYTQGIRKLLLASGSAPRLT